MEESDRSRSRPRQPLQRRTKDRFEQVLDEARVLLRERGLAGFSIPELANRLGSSRAAIYNFFPTPYAVFNELTRRYLEQLESALLHEAAALQTLPWAEGTRALTARTAQFYNDNPVACVLILGGPISDESYLAQEMMIGRMARMVQQLFEQRGVVLPPAPPDVPLLAVEIGTTCYRVSYFLHGRVTPEYRAEAAEAMIAYLSRYVRNAAAARRERGR